MRAGINILAGAWLISSAVLSGVAAEGSGVSTDKSGYNLFKPVPDELMREMAPERPDKTDSPFTLDAGHFEIEMDFFNLTYNDPNSERGRTRFDSFEVAPMNLRVGLLNDVDFQVAFTTFHWEETKDLRQGTVRRRWGFDGITPRVAVNIVGNDGGFFALGLIPFIKAPLNTGGLGNSSVEGGIAVPYSFEVSGWDVGFQTVFRASRDENGGGHHAEFDNSVSIGHSLVGKLSAAAEFFSSVSTEKGSEWIGTVDILIFYEINKNVRLDSGVFIGVTAAADDWHPWMGMTWRF